jgi:hypothetical protein
MVFFIFYYGMCSIKKPFSVTGDELDEHFQFSVKAEVVITDFLKVSLGCIGKDNPHGSPRSSASRVYFASSRSNTASASVMRPALMSAMPRSMAASSAASYEALLFPVE